MNQLLEYAAEGDTDAVRALVDSAPETVGARGWATDTTALIVASHRGHDAVVEVLLAAKADVNAREGASGATALHWAACGGHPEVARRLVAAGTELEARDAWYALSPLGWALVPTELHDASPDARDAVAELLLAAGAALDAFCRVALGRFSGLEEATRRLGPAADHDTALHFAVRRGLADAVPALLAQGADPSALNDLGISPRALAVGTPLRDAMPGIDPVTAFREGDEDARVDPKVLHGLARLGDAESVARLLERGVEVDVTVEARCGDGRAPVTALTRIAASGSATVADRLLAAGADPNVRMAGSGLTPLHRAAASGHESMVEVLLAHGADPTLVDHELGATPADLASYFDHAGTTALIERPGAP